MKRIIALFVCLVLCVGIMNVSVDAAGATIDGEGKTIGLADSINASNPPPTNVSYYFNLSTVNNYYTATLTDLAAARGSYTRKFFSTGTGAIFLKCDLLRSGTTNPMSRQLIIKLYKRSGSSYYGTYVSQEVVNFDSDGTYRRVLMHLDTNCFYYLYFYNNSSSNPNSSQDISGSIIIDDVYQ